MSRFVVRVNGSTGPDNKAFTSVNLEEPEVGDSVPLNCDIGDPEFQRLRATAGEPDAVRGAGGRLFEALRSGSPKIGDYLQAALHTVDERYPVYVQIATKGEELPWESLCDPGGNFLALDRRWSLARMVHMVGGGERFPLFSLRPPIRIAAVLSGLGLPAEGELRALRQAIADAGPEHVRLLVFSGEEELITDLQKEIDSGAAPEVHGARMVPGAAKLLQDQITGFNPDIVHFFCHGSASPPQLEIACKSAFQCGDNPPAAAFLTLGPGDFQFTGKTKKPWLLVLNCCEGAGASGEPGSNSLAYSLARAGRAAAVIGMREPIVPSQANIVTRYLYADLLRSIVAHIDTADGGPAAVDLPALLVGAREELARAAQPGMGLAEAAPASRDWTLPVMYVQDEPFTLLIERAPLIETPPPITRGGITGLRKAEGFDADLFGLAPRSTASRARLELTALRGVLCALPESPREVVDAVRERIATLNAQFGISQPDNERMP